MKIPVKIGWELIFILMIPFISMLYEFFKNPKITIIILALCYLLFVGFTVFGIKYEIQDNNLEIINAFFGKTKINIHEIIRIEKTWNMIASPAPSILGRVEIYYIGNSIVISPKHFEDLKNQLLKINPKITVKL